MRYDPQFKRWIAVAIIAPGTAASSLLLGVSRSENPAFTNWNRYRFDVDANNNTWADYPTLGYNKHWIVAQVNMLPINTNGVYGSQIFVFTKTNYYAGVSNAPRRFSGVYTNSGWSQFPATTYDTNAESLYFVQNVVGHYNLSTNQIVGLIALWKLSGAIGSESLTNLGLIGATPWADKVNEATTVNVDSAPQLGSSVKILNNDSRMLSVVQRNGHIWATHNVFLPYDSSNPRTAVQWWELSTNVFAYQTGRIDDSSGTTDYAFGSIAVNRFNDALIGYSSFSSNQYASAAYSFQDFFTSTLNEFQLPRIFKSGTDVYWKTYSSGTRWGDYSATVVDPLNDADFWTVQEYATNHVGSLTNFSGRWATWWAKVTLTVPPNDHFTNRITITGTLGSTNGTNLRATAEPGEPSHAGNTSVKSVWYQWTPSVTGPVVFDTIDPNGNTFDSVLAVYTGTSVGGLTLVTNNHGGAGGGASRVVFDATSGTIYKIAVDGWASPTAVGGFTLNWNQPAAPLFTTQPTNQTVYQGNNATFVSVAIGRPAPTYQWRSNDVNIAGATSANYTIANVQTNHAASYTVVASNSSGSSTSQVAVLTVLSSQATLSSTAYTNNQFLFAINQVAGLRYGVEGNTNLNTSNWIRLATNTAPFTFTDTGASNSSQQFYRAVYLP